jgi:hypothetical protein
MPDEQWTQVIQALLTKAERERVPLAEITEIVQSAGYRVESPGDGVRCRALTALARGLMKDDGFQRLLALLQERRAIKILEDVLSLDREEYNQLFEREKVLYTEVNDLLAKQAGRISLLRQISGLLTTLNCTDRFDLPEFEVRLQID